MAAFALENQGFEGLRSMIWMIDSLTQHGDIALNEIDMPSPADDFEILNACIFQSLQPTQAASACAEGIHIPLRGLNCLSGQAIGQAADGIHKIAVEACAICAGVMAHFIEHEGLVFQAGICRNALRQAFGRDFSGKYDSGCAQIFEEACGIGAEYAGLAADMKSGMEIAALQISLPSGS